MSSHDLALRNKFLVALPSMADDAFNQTVIYICDHSKDGTMGIVINQPLEISLLDVFKQLEFDTSTPPSNASPVFKGGPVKAQRGFLLHTPAKAQWGTSMEVSKDVMLTASKDVLESIAYDQGPEHYLFALGFSGWSPGQLEAELKDNCWLTTEANLDTLFNCPAKERWQSLYTQMGLDPNFIAPGGNA